MVELVSGMLPPATSPIMDIAWSTRNIAEDLSCLFDVTGFTSQRAEVMGPTGHDDGNARELIKGTLLPQSILAILHIL